METLAMASPNRRRTMAVTATRLTDNRVMCRYSGRLLILPSMAFPRDA